jgi:transcriptional regulator with XRE-family HTH domain
MSSGSYGRVVQRARLTRELQELRRSRQETQEASAKALRWSVSKLIRVEGGWVGLSHADLEYLLKHYGVTEEKEVSRLAQIAEDARSPGWWDKYKIPDKDFMAYVGYEAGSSFIRMTDGYLVPGPLQTDEYMRALTRTYKPVGGLEAMIGLRQARQRDLRARRPEQIYVLDEAVLRRRVGDVSTTRTQLQHLVELSARPEVTILVIPFDAGPHYGMKGPFALLSFDTATGLDDILYLESVRRGDLVETEGQNRLGQDDDAEPMEADDVAEARDGFDAMVKVALDRGASRKFIERVARERG